VFWCARRVPAVRAHRAHVCPGTKKCARAFAGTRLQSIIDCLYDRVFRCSSSNGGHTVKIATRSFTVYQSVRKALERQGIHKAGATATLILEAILVGDGRLVASTVYARGLCEEKQFREWRKNLVDKGWLVWCETQTDKGAYYPGKKFIPYINKEKLAQKEIATRESVEKVRSDLSTKIDTKADRSELEATKAELAGFRARMLKFERLAQRLAVATGDPITAHKIEEQKRCAEELNQLVN
jgi:hypothetical protein